MCLAMIFYPKLQREHELVTLSERTEATIDFIKPIKHVSMDYDGNRTFIRAYEVGYQFYINGSYHTASDYIRNSIDNQDFINKINTKKLTSVQIAYNPEDVTQTRIIKNEDISDEHLPSENETITEFGETEPQFPGGAAELQRYIMKSFPWDSIREEDLLEVSKIYLSFVVTKTGEIKQLQIHKGSHPNIDPLIFKFVSEMPLWIPGKNEKDEPINMEVRLPIQVCLK